MDNLGDLSALGDLSSMVNSLLSDPEAMNGLRQAAEQMGLGELLSGGSSSGGGDAVSEHSQQRAEKRPPSSAFPDGELLSAVTKLAPLLSAPQEDDASRLLAALRPFLSQPRAQKLDQAERLLSLTRVLSILKESKLM